MCETQAGTSKPSCISHCSHRILIHFFCPTFLIRGVRRVAGYAITQCTRIKSESYQICHHKQCLVLRACDFIHHNGQIFACFVISGYLFLLTHSMNNPLALIFNLSRSFLKTTSSYPHSPNLHRLFYFISPWMTCLINHAPWNNPLPCLWCYISVEFQQRQKKTNMLTDSKLIKLVSCNKDRFRFLQKGYICWRSCTEDETLVTHIS